jgi:CBS domain-containing protein
MSLYRLCVADVMSFDPVVVRADAPIEDAEELLEANRISGLPVVDAAGTLVGVISQTDLIRLAHHSISDILRARPDGLRVGEVMTSPPLTVPMTASLVEAARLMHDARVHRLVALDDEDEPVGVLSASDYVTLVAEG